MALQKSIERADGVTADYWRVSSIQIDAVKATALIVLGGYVSEEFRQRSAAYIVDRREFVLDSQQFAGYAMSPARGDSTFDAIAGACYSHIKEHSSEFADAVDV